jgi:hypothetical protein
MGWTDEEAVELFGGLRIPKAAQICAALSLTSASSCGTREVNEASSNLDFHQSFFLQFSRRERAHLFLVPVGPAVMGRHRLKLANRASRSLDSALAFASRGLALLPGPTAQRVVEAESVHSSKPCESQIPLHRLMFVFP